MITIEHNDKHTDVFIIDPEGELEDIEMIVTDRGYFIRQWSEELGGYDLVELSPTMLGLLVKSLGLPEGTYVTL